MSGVVIELQSEALDSSVSESFLLRKALVVARKLSVSDFEQWAKLELNGYEGVTEVPPYRRLLGEIKGHNPFHGWQPVLFPETIHDIFTSPMTVRQPLPVVESLLNESKEGGLLILLLPAATQQDLIKLTNCNYQFAFHIQRSALAGILSGARDGVLSWALQLEERGIIGNGLSFTQKEREVAATMTNVVNYYGNVGQSQVMSHSPGAGQSINVRGVDRDALKELVTSIRREKANLKLPDTEAAIVTAELATIEAQLLSPTPKSTIIKDSLETLKRIVEGVMGGLGGNILTELVRNIQIIT